MENIINKILNANATFSVIEDNAGGLVVCATKGRSVVFAGGWERQPGALRAALADLAVGGDPADWDIPESDRLTGPQWAAIADGGTVVCDMMGIKDCLGVAAARELAPLR